VTSHASQGVTVDKVFVGLSSQSFSATDQRTAYVAVTRGREQAQIFTDDRKELLRVVSRTDEPISATELAGSRKPTLVARVKSRLAFARRLALFASRNDAMHLDVSREATAEREVENDR
jgi:hypothetical protein